VSLQTLVISAQRSFRPYPLVDDVPILIEFGDLVPPILDEFKDEANQMTLPPSNPQPNKKQKRNSGLTPYLQ
jgi:hypothetical protein